MMKTTKNAKASNSKLAAKPVNGARPLGTKAAKAAKAPKAAKTEAKPVAAEAKAEEPKAAKAEAPKGKAPKAPKAAAVWALTKKALDTEAYPTRALAVWEGLQKVEKGTAEEIAKHMPYKGTQDKARLASFFLHQFERAGAVKQIEA